jgi:hypothetical protein
MEKIDTDRDGTISLRYLDKIDAPRRSSWRAGSVALPLIATSFSVMPSNLCRMPN